MDRDLDVHSFTSVVIAAKLYYIHVHIIEHVKSLSSLLIAAKPCIALIAMILYYTVVSQVSVHGHLAHVGCLPGI